MSHSQLPTEPGLRRLGDVVTFLDHKRRPITEADRKPGPFPYLGANGQQGTIDDFLFDEQLVLLAEDGGHFENPRRGIAYRVSGKVWVNNHAHVLRPTSKIDWAYLTRVLENKDVRHYISGTTRSKLTKAQAEKILIPLPPIPEQRRIATILDQADALRAKRRASLARLDEMGPSIFEKMFRPDGSQDYSVPVEALGAHLSFVTSGGRGWARFYGTEGSRFIRSLDVRMNQISDGDPVFVNPPNGAEAERTRIKSGDVLLTITGSRIGRVAAVGSDYDGAYISQHVAILRPRKSILARYLAFYLSSPDGGQVQIAKSQYGQTKPGLNFEQIKRFKVPMPPPSQQAAFVEKLQEIDSIHSNQITAMSALDSLFGSLQHRAFRGEL